MKLLNPLRMGLEGDRYNPTRSACRLLLFLLLWSGAVTTRADDASYSEQLDWLIPTPPVTNAPAQTQPEIATFEKGFTNQVRAMAQPHTIAQQPLPNTSVGWACVAAAALALAMRFLGPRAVVRFTKEGQALVALALHPETLRAEEKTFAAFVSSFRVGAGRPRVTPKDPADEKTEAAHKLLEQAAANLSKLRKIFGKLGPLGDATRQAVVLAELCQELRDFKAAMNLPKLLPIWNLSLALEGLLKQFQLRTADMTPSALRTAASALDTLDWLATQRVTNNVFGCPPVKLLVVDDDAISLRAVTHALKQSFDPPDVAADGEAGLKLAQENPYDVIFLDVEMPGIDGFELCSKIRESVRNRETPIVFVTSHTDFNSRAKAPLKGAQDLIAKPFLKFEITVKALTLILRYRLRIGPQHPALRATVQQPDTAQTPQSKTPKKQKEIAAAAAGQSAATTAAKPSSSSPPGSVSPPPSPATTKKVDDDSATATSKPAEKEKPAIGANALAAGKSEQFSTINKQLEAIGSAETETIRQNVLGDVRLSLSIIGEDAARTGRSAAFKLCCLAETLLTKVLDDPKRLQRSTLGAIAVTVEVLEQLFATPKQPKLDEPARIMIVDDDPLTRRALSGALQLALGKPNAVEDGETAVSMARKSPFDLIFMDVRMPGMGGFEAALRIRESGCNPKAQIVFVTSRSDEEFRDQAGRAGASAFITKPFVVAEITLTALAFTFRNRLSEITCSEPAEAAVA